MPKRKQKQPKTVTSEAEPDTELTADQVLEQRIEDQREELFGAMAIIAVARDSVNFDDDCNLHRALDDVYSWLNKISCDVKVAMQGVRHA